MTYDIAIIGGGPAGSSAATALSGAGARVLLLERGTFPRHKVCGEFVSAESLGLLNSLVPMLFKGHVSKFEITRTRLLVDGRVVEARISPPAASITRFDLDLALWNAAVTSGAACRDNCDVKSAVNTAEGFTLQAAGTEFHARALIDATGRWSRLRDDTVPPGPKWIGLKCHYRESGDRERHADDRPLPPEDCSVDLYFFDGGYCGVQPISPGVFNACAMVRSDCATTLPEVFALHPQLESRAQHWTPLFEPISTAPLVFRDPQPHRTLNSTAVDGNGPKLIVCVGDAAAFIDPFVGDGISLALRTGVAAAESLISFAQGRTKLEQAAAAYAGRYHREFAPILKSAARVRRLLDLPRPLRAIGLTAMRLPFISDYVIRSTRSAS